MIYPIIAYGDPILKKVAKEVSKSSDTNIKKLVEDMFETMYAAEGVGLAAPQIGKSIRIFVIDPEPIDKDNLKNSKKVFINPQKIEEKGKEFLFEEGCLSIPNIRGEVTRPDTITIHYFDENWSEREEKFGGIVARVIQHEYDHLEGKLFIEHIDPLKKRLIEGKLQAITRGKVKATYRMKFPKKR